MVKYNFKGWNWKKWLSGNEEALKLALAGLFGLWASSSLTGAALSAGALKLCLDALHYWAAE